MFFVNFVFNMTSIATLRKNTNNNKFNNAFILQMKLGEEVLTIIFFKEIEIKLG